VKEDDLELYINSGNPYLVIFNRIHV